MARSRPTNGRNGRYPLSEQDRVAAKAAAHIQDTIGGLELKIISQEGA
jgi:hypothetical protein